MQSITIKSNDFKTVTPAFDEQDPLYVCDIGWHKTPTHHSFGPYVRPYYLLHLVVKGMGYVERNGVPVLVPEGTAFLIRPDETTTYYADEDEPWEYYWISFHGTFAKELLSRITDKLFIPFQKSGILALQSTLDKETNSFTALLNTLFTVLDSLKPNVKNTSDGNEAALAMRYMENYYYRNISIAELAAQFGYSRSYFSTLFQKLTGETPYAYLTKIRIQRAKEYLRNTNLSVEEIAYTVGFSSLQRFCEMFKKQTEFSPLQYRSANEF